MIARMARPLLVALALFSAAHAMAQSPPRTVDEKAALAKPFLVVPPEFPDHAAPGNAAVEIRITGTVSQDGRLTSPVFDAKPDEGAYVDAVRKVLDMWRFVPAVATAACRPKQSEMTLSVWFERKDGKPSVSVSAPKGPESKGEPRLSWSYRPRIQYPYRALRNGIEGDCLVLFKATSKGEIEDANIRVCAPPGPFEAATIEGIETGEYQPFHPADYGGKEVLCSEVEVRYCIPDGRVEVPSTRCRH